MVKNECKQCVTAGAGRACVADGGASLTAYAANASARTCLSFAITAACALSGIPVTAAQQASADHPSAESRLVCESAGGGRQHCAADTSAGVALVRATGDGACLLGNTWGYDDDGIWVTDGCGGEFVVGRTDAAGAGTGTSPEPNAPVWREAAEDYAWGFLDPGNGFLVGRSDIGAMSISGYALTRYLDQQGNDTFIDHNGNEQPVDLRRDILSHRVLLWLKGWLGSEKLIYTITLWTVTATDQDALFANLGYRFNDKFNLYAGVYGNPGSRSMQGSHPYWLGHDRVMADEFFRPFFTQGIYANGELLPGLWYSATVGNNNSTLGIKASELDRNFTKGASVWWMPTTHEFGPRGAYGDFEMHDALATRFGFSFTDSPEQRYNAADSDPRNTSLRLTDSTNVFNTGALAPGVTVSDVDFRVMSADAGFKYRGLFVQAEYYSRWLDNFRADGVLPYSEIVDTGFYVQASFFPLPRKLELYAATSKVYGDDDASIGDASEVLVGMNYYPFDSRNYRLNLQVIDVERSPVSSSFGYYTGGQDGRTVSAAFSVFF